jgi:hypothetical protein
MLAVLVVIAYHAPIVTLKEVVVYIGEVVTGNGSLTVDPDFPS